MHRGDVGTKAPRGSLNVSTSEAESAAASEAVARTRTSYAWLPRKNAVDRVVKELSKDVAHRACLWELPIRGSV